LVGGGKVERKGAKPRLGRLARGVVVEVGWED